MGPKGGCLTRMPLMRRSFVLLALALLVLSVGCGSSKPKPKHAGLDKIKHIVVIMQENRSFDSYFGTYPGADGLPRDPQGNFTTCNPNPATGQCDKPFHDSSERNSGGPHSQPDATADIDGGRMDGFVRQAESKPATCPAPTVNPDCRAGGPVDVMGYHDAHEIPNYWTYADPYVLQDRMF